MILSYSVIAAQTITCTETEAVTEDSEYPTITKTCFYKNIKFVEVAYPDHVGRYAHREYSTFICGDSQWVEARNSVMFNRRLAKLEKIINERIQADFLEFSTDSLTRDCFERMDSIPFYSINDLGISFHEEEIWFSVDWGMSWACLPVSSSIVSFPLREIRKYLR